MDRADAARKVNRQPSRHENWFAENKIGEGMNARRGLRNFSTLWLTTIVLACFSDAVAQASYKVTDLGTGRSEKEACAMSVNDEGWTEIMTWNGEPGQDVDFIAATLLSGRALIDVDGFKHARRAEQLDELGRDQ
jgi:hypothetical protein